MSRETLEATKAELYAVLAGAGLAAHVYPHDPGPGRTGGPTAVCVSTAGLTDTSYLLAVRVYADAEVDAVAAQAAVDRITQEVDELLATYWGPQDWEVGYSEDYVKFVAACRIEVGREDGRYRPGFGQG